ncbi:DUF4834 family protein [Sphingobacterium sp. N143]|uniref:DUF4834 family protein n=1 Tax=Sphingobacterium sp. N143 TaxID=2746727 RepID=UPI0025769A19|nr:DUF4834 family protein [Sphingobacterium sp. N143]
MAFLKFILITFAVYFVVRFLFRLFLPFAMRKAAEKLMKKAQQQGGAYSGQGGTFYYEFTGQGQQESKRSQPEGKIKVDYVPPKDAPERKGTETAGEFVDFEEIK